MAKYFGLFPELLGSDQYVPLDARLKTSNMILAMQGKAYALRNIHKITLIEIRRGDLKRSSLVSRTTYNNQDKELDKPKLNP